MNTQSPHPTFMTGDFHIHADSDNQDAVRFRDLLGTFNLVQHVKFPTHRSGHMLDLMITGGAGDLCLESPKQGYLISDLLFVLSSLNVPRPPLCKTTISFRQCRKIDKDAFEADLGVAVTAIVKTSDVDEAATLYIAPWPGF